MKWIALAALAAVGAVPATAQSNQSKPPFKMVPIGGLPHVDTSGPAQWGMSGSTILTVNRGLNGANPYMRTAVYDARMVEIFSRVQAPPLRGRDVKVVPWNGKDYIVIRGYLIAEVTPGDAAAADTTMTSLADKWAASMRKVLPTIAPQPNELGV